jgi:hypothetical protein
MDPASAIGVAAATVQFFAIGVKAIRQGRQICISKTGTTEAYEALEVAIKEMREVRKDLRHDIVRNVDSNIAKAQKQCLEISEKLLKILESIKASSRTAKSKLLKDVTATWQVMRAGSKIDKLEQELQVAQNHFKEALTVETRNAIAQVLENQGKDTSTLQLMWDDIRHLRPELQQARKENNAAHQEILSGIARIEHISVAQHTSTLYSHQATCNAIEGLDTSVQAQFSNMRMTDVHRDILASLHYSDMLTRQQDISPPATGTYEWVFTGESPYQTDPKRYEDILLVDLERRKKLFNWFSNNDSLFWINGKPGSGKSSLMSFVANDERSLHALRAWAGQQPVHIIKFFFWRPGSPLQRSVPGLLRSLLYQALMIDTSVINKLLAQGSIKQHSTWAQVELLRTLEVVLQRLSNERLCFFIDGLDEHDGDYMSLLDLILQMQFTPNIKICLSSRPEPAFRHRLSACPSISMQDVNASDIETLVRQKLEPSGTKFLILFEEVTRRAEGVVLWAALVCNSLLRGLTMRDDELMLRKRLNETPSGLKDLFRHLFAKIDDLHREHLRLYCHMLYLASEVDHSTNYTTLSVITWVLQSADIRSVDHFIPLCATSEQQIVGQSQGLIEVRDDRGESAKALWSLRQAADQGILQYKSHARTSELLKQYSLLRIRWVHRSAHDCIFGEPGELIAPWIILTDDLALKRKLLECLMWLAEHSPMFGIWEFETRCALHTSVSDLVRDVLPLAAFDDGAQIVGRLHDLIASAFPGRDRQNRREELQFSGVLEHQVSIELEPLFQLWNAVLNSGRLRSIEVLVDRPFAAVICSALLSSSGNRREDLMDGLLGCISRDLQLRADVYEIPTDFWSNRQFGFRTYNEFLSILTGQPVVLSWLGSHDRDEADIMHGLALLLGPGSSLPNQFWPQILALMKARDVWRGPQVLDERKNLLSLQVLLPNNAFLHWWAASRSPASPLLANIPSPFRLVFMHWSERITVSQKAHQQLMFKPRIVASYDLSTTTSATLLSRRTRWSECNTVDRFFTVCKSPVMTWIGTAVEFSACLHAILDDIWQNRGQQLDAWQQLYALACVKICFRRMWRIGDEAEVVMRTIWALERWRMAVFKNRLKGRLKVSRG